MKVVKGGKQTGFEFPSRDQLQLKQMFYLPIVIKIGNDASYTILTTNNIIIYSPDIEREIGSGQNILSPT